MSVLIATATSLVGLNLSHVGLPGAVLAGFFLRLLLLLLGGRVGQKLGQLRAYRGIRNLNFSRLFQFPPKILRKELKLIRDPI